MLDLDINKTQNKNKYIINRRSWGLDSRRKEILADLNDSLYEGDREDLLRHSFGLIIFMIISIIIIPQILLNMGLRELLSLYLPNIDMLAVVLTFLGGPGNIWEKLYVADANYFMQFTSQTIINYAALIGLCYIVAEKAHKEGLYIGWSYALIMVLMSYLIPGYFIETAMDYSYIYTNSMIISTLAALLVIKIILFGEAYIILYRKKDIAAIGKYIMESPNLFKRMFK